MTIRFLMEWLQEQLDTDEVQPDWDVFTTCWCGCGELGKVLTHEVELVDGGVRIG